jgi:hypothetical protein
MDDLTMSSMLVAELNNLGVERLHQGHLRGALHLFREALSYTAINLRLPGYTTSYNNDTGGSTTSTLNTATTATRPLRPMKKKKNDKSAKDNQGSAAAAVVAATAQNTTATTRPGAAAAAIAVTEPPQQPQHHADAADASSLLSTPFIHSKGINVIPMATAYSPDMLINTVIVSSIVVFNLAIVCHLKGLQQGGGGSGSASVNSRLVKAKSLYERSQQLLADARVPCHYSLGNPVTDMLYMASLNNLAQLHYEMAQYSESKRYFDTLVDFSATIVPRIYGNDYYVASLMERTKANFLLNAIILRKEPSLAPAA